MNDKEIQDAFRQAANHCYADDDCMILSDANVNLVVRVDATTDKQEIVGAWISARVWVSRDTVPALNRKEDDAATHAATPLL